MKTAVNKFLPMRARKDGNIKFPCIAQIKIDGVRVLVKDGVVYSRTLTPIPNKHVQKLFGHLNGFDGELLVSPDPAARLFNETQSAVMTIEGEPKVYFHIYDSWLRQCGYELWHCHYYSLCERDVVLHKYIMIENANHLQLVYAMSVNKGLEGLIVRNPESPYHCGTATKKDWQLVKMKPKDDAEFKVVGFQELMVNTNEQETNSLGRAKRSSKKEGKVVGNTLGALIVEFGNKTFKVGTGFDAEQRKQIWENQEQYLGVMARIEYEGIAKNFPRFPSFKGFRVKEDII